MYIKRLNIATFNILSDKLSYFNYGLCEKSEDTKDNMFRYNVVFRLLENPDNDMDIVFLQEVGKLFRDNFLYKLEKNYHIISGKQHQTEKDILVILLNKKKFDPEYVVESWLNDILPVRNYSDNIDYDYVHRKFLVAKVSTTDNDKFVLINVHLPTDEYLKSYIVESINENLRDLQNSNKMIHIICAGDFNIHKDYDVDVIRNLTPLFDGDKSVDYTSFKMGICKPNKSNKQTFTNLDRPHKFLDRIYISDNLKVSTESLPLIPIHNYKINNETKYVLGKPTDSFSNHGYPFTLIRNENGKHYYETLKYQDIINNHNKYQWPSDHALLMTSVYYDDKSQTIGGHVIFDHMWIVLMAILILVLCFCF